MSDLRARVVVVGVAATLAIAWPWSPGILEPCRVTGVVEPARCLSVEVPESPLDPAGRRLRIQVVVLLAKGPAPHREPLVLIQGGPGVPGTLMALNFQRRVALRDRRDLVFFDQRGTGGSGSLNCAVLNRFNFRAVSHGSRGGLPTDGYSSGRPRHVHQHAVDRGPRSRA
jgi:hypothetical protein